MAGYTLPNTAFGSPNFGIPTGTANTTDQYIAAIAANLTALNTFEGAITSLPAGPSGTTTAIIGSAAGTTGQGTTASIAGNDLAGTVTVTGITGTATGPYATVTFGGRAGVGAGPSGVVVSGPGGPYATGISSTGFTVNTTLTVAGSAKLSYLVLG